MPLGDSITGGYGVAGGYRTQLYSNLVNAGYSFTFVGANPDNPSPTLTAADQVFHNGYGGFRVNQITANIVGGGDWLSVAPDIILLLVGTNDYSQNQDPSHAIDRLDTLVAAITSRRPEAILIVANLLVRTDDPLMEARIQSQFNDFVPGLVSRHATLGEKVFFLDLHSALSPLDIIDGVHPKKAGYTKLGDAWFQAIQDALGAHTNGPATLAGHTLTVGSVNPVTGVGIMVSPADQNGLGNGATLFTRTYSNSAVVSLSAPASAGGKSFVKWQCDGADLSTNLLVTVTMDTNHILTASYAIPSTLGAGPLVRLSFNEASGSILTNAGTAGGVFEMTPGAPTWSTNAPADAGGGSALDFGFTQGDFAMDSAGVIPALRGLGGFTITAWINSRSPVQGPGGNRLVTWMNNSGDGVDLAYLGDGSVDLGVNRSPDGTARSSAGRIPESFDTPQANWRFVAVTYDAGAGQAGFYFGSPESDATLDVVRDYSRGPVGSEIGRLTIGHSNPSTRPAYLKRIFRGLIDNVQIYDRVLPLWEMVVIQRTAPIDLTNSLPGAPPRIVGITRVLDGSVRLEVAGTANRLYRILAARELGGWMPLTEVTVGVSGSIEFLDSEAAGIPTRFYSVVEP